MSLTRFPSTILLSLVLLAACGESPQPNDDAGPVNPPDAGPRDAGPPLACSETRRVDGVLGETVTVMFDTRMTETRPRDLGLTCGNTDPELRWAPQEVVELRVPGTGRFAVDLDTVFDGDTDADFNTVLQVRTTCETAPTATWPPTCFDDVSLEEFRSRGSFMANGGDTVFIIVTGYSEPPAAQGTVDEGRVRLDITVRENTAPTVTSGSFALALDDVELIASGHDPDADAYGVLLNFYGPGGQLLDIYGDGQATLDGDAFPVLFKEEPNTADYEGHATVPAITNLAPFLRAVGARRASFRVFDRAFEASEPLMVDIVEGTFVGIGEACGGTNVCRKELTCTAGICAATGEVAAACENARVIEVQPNGQPVDVTGTTGAGVGSFAPKDTACGGVNATIGAEAIYAVTIPEGVTADLLITTNLPATGDTDTVLYVRSECADSGTELDCEDNRARGDLQSDNEVYAAGPGTYYIFVERWGGLAMGTIPHALRVTLRPVLESGATCDPSGTLNRCRLGACTDGICP